MRGSDGGRACEVLRAGALLMKSKPVALSGESELAAENRRLRGVCARAEAAASRHSIMLREADHRIKNSLQIVAGLMQIQARREESPSARAALGAAATRIRSVASIHDTLQKNPGNHLVDLGAMLQSTCLSLQSMAGDSRFVSVVVSADPVHAPVAIAQPVVLAINELVINAMRHAFQEGQTGVIEVTADLRDGELRLVVADNGKGLPANYTEGRGYGMRLVKLMVTQMGGALEAIGVGGARFTLTVPVAANGPVIRPIVADNRAWA